MITDIDQLVLPKDRKTMNATNRFYYRTEPIVAYAVHRHTLESLGATNFVSDSKMRFVARDSSSQKELDVLVISRDLTTLVTNIARDYWMLGEVFPYTAMEAYPEVGAMTVINPDQVRVKKVLGGQDKILLTANESTDDFDTPQPDAKSISHIKMLDSPYDIRGTSVIVSVYKELAAIDEMRRGNMDSTHIDTIISATKAKLMFGYEATLQEKHSEFRVALIAWFECIMNRVPNLAGSTIRFS